LDALPKGSKCNQDYCIDNILLGLDQVRTGNARHKVAMTLMMHMDNSMDHNGAKFSEKMSLNGLGRVSHPAYSPDISSCDFWTFRTIKEMIKDRHFQSPE
jgi:hypothetical protein